MNNRHEPSDCQPKSLTLFHYGELGEAERLRVENHIRGCADCRRELAQLSSTLQMLPKDEPEIPREAVQSLNERVSRRLRPRPRPALRPVMGWSLATATALLLTVTFHAPTPGPQQRPSEVSWQTGAETERLPDPALLMNLDLLENLDLLQELEGTGASG